MADVRSHPRVCVTTIFRIATFHNINSYDLTWSYIDTAYWTYSELVLSFICACVPTFRGVINHFTSSVPSYVPDSANAIKRFASNSVSRLGIGGSPGSGTTRGTGNGSGGSKNKSQTGHPGGGQHPTTTFDSLGLARQGSMPMTSVGSNAGFERIEDPNMHETKVFSGSGKEERVEKEGQGEWSHHSDIESLPVSGIHVQKDLDQTD